MARGWSDAYGLFLKGEADMVLSYTTSPAYHAIVENDPNFGAAVFAEGHYPQIEIAGILKTSKNVELARKFLSWVTTPEAQAIIATTNWMYPVTLGTPLPDAFGTPPEKILTLDEATITADKSTWIDEALAAIR
jgi:thiamine transport system substrate-binding protein